MQTSWSPLLPEEDVGKMLRHRQYGYLGVAARYCGLRRPLSKLYSEWQHGWHPPSHNFHPELVVGTDGRSAEVKQQKRFLVAREDQEQFLRSLGYADVHAVGLPLIYQPPAEVTRRAGALLVMPVHSLAYTQHSWNFEQYADEIEALRGRFAEIVVCVHPSCWERGYWVDAFQQRGFKVIRGANFRDARAYERLAALFGQVEFVTSNGFGSHLVYASFFGARASIDGTFAQIRAEDYAGSALYQRHPSMLERVVALLDEPALREEFPHLFRQPWQVELQVEWARDQLGWSCRRSPAELLELLGWRRFRAWKHLVALLRECCGR